MNIPPLRLPVGAGVKIEIDGEKHPDTKDEAADQDEVAAVPRSHGGVVEPHPA